MSKLFYSTSEVAALFGVNRVTIYRWVKGEKIEAYKIGKRHKIPVSEVERLLKEFGFSELAIRDLYSKTNNSRLSESAKDFATD